jgi:hypothetical protein
MDVKQVARRVTQIMDMSAKEVFSPGKYRRIVYARSLLCYWAVREIGISMAAAHQLGDGQSIGSAE